MTGRARTRYRHQVAERRKRSSKKSGFPLLRVVLAGIAIALLAVVVLIALVHGGAFGKLPTKEDLGKIRNEEATLVLATDGTIIGKLFSMDRTNVRYEDLPQHLIDALVSTEDSRFFRHEGVDAFSYLRVLVRTVLGGDRRGGGGSTISQQIVKNLYGRERHGVLSMPVNKIKEAVVAYRLEQVYDKQEVLLLYFNSVPFGENVYGIGSAARRFFGKPVERLPVEECAVLVGMLKANTAYNPRLHPQAAMNRRNTVLGLMNTHGHLTDDETERLQALPIELKYSGNDALDLYAYFVDRVAKEANTIIDAYNEREGTVYDILTDGLRIHTTLEPALQHSAAEAARRHLASMQPKLDAELRSRKVRAAWEKQKDKKADRAWKANSTAPRELFTFNGNSVEDISYRDSLWHYQKMLHAAVFMMEPSSGRVRAWVGGNDHQHLPYDLVRAERPIASTIKPVIYAAALEGGMEPCTYLSNEQVEYEAYDNWSPDNFSHDSIGGEVAMWYALTRSMNLPTVDLYFRTDRAVQEKVFTGLGLSVRSLDNPAVALGAADISLERIVSAYGAFAMRGDRVRPWSVEKITDAEGKVLYKAPKATSTHAMSDSTAAAITAMLQRAVNEGTGASLRNTFGLRMDLAGKTGTSQDYSDAWFIGYTPGLAIGAWVGAMDPSIHFSGGNGTGSKLALPIVGSVLRDVERSPELRKRYARPFSWIAEFPIDMACDARRRRSGIQEFFDDLFQGDDKERKEGREERRPKDHTQPETPLQPREKESLFDRLFKKKK